MLQVHPEGYAACRRNAGLVRLDAGGTTRVRRTVNTITLEGAGTAAVNGNYTFNPGPAPSPTMDNGFWEKGDGYIITKISGIWSVWDQNVDYAPLYTCPEHDFPCGPWLVAEGSAPAPTGSFFNGAAAFSYSPASATISWTDSGGNHSGNLAAFNATADMGTVSVIELINQGIVSISNLSSLPGLITIELTGNDITSLDVSGLSSLQVLNTPNCASLTSIAGL